MNKSFELTPTRLGELRGFAAAARLLNFSRAAREVGCTPSVLSRRIASLEKAIGGKLFQRTTRRVVLTARGERLLAHCRRLDEVVTELVAAMRPESEAPAGRLTVHLPASYGRLWIAPLIARFALVHPRVRIDAIYADDYVDLVAVKADLAVRVGTLADARLVARKVGNMRCFLCAAPDYLASAPQLRDPADLRHHRCIAFSGRRTGTLLRFTRKGVRRSVRFDPVLATNDAQAVCDAALAGVGIGLQGDYMAGPLVAAGRLVEVLQDWSLPPSPVHLLWLPGADREPATRALIDFLVDALRSPR